MFIKRKRLIGAISGVLILAGLSVPAMADTAPEPGSAADEAVAGLVDALATLPSEDASITSRQNAVVFDLSSAMECIPVADIFYCPLTGWAYQEPLIEPYDDKAFNEVGGMNGGFTRQQIGSLPLEEQIELVRADLEKAVSSAGKVLADYSMMSGETLSPELVDGLLGAAEYLADVNGQPETSATLAQVTPMLDPTFNYQLVKTTNAGKQQRSYWCGPASMAFISMHDPVARNYSHWHSQANWAGWLGTTASAGTNFYNMLTELDGMPGFSPRVGGYVQGYVGGWNNVQWWNRFFNTTYQKKAPILLNPRLTIHNSRWIHSSAYSTGGHYNVGIGLWTDPQTGDWAWLYEPYAGAGNIPTLVWEHMDNIRLQNNANTQLIAY